MFILYIYKSVPTSFSNLLLEFIDITWSYATESSFTLLDQNVQKKKLYLHGTSRAKKSNITIEEGIRTQEWIPYIASKTTYENIFGLLQKKNSEPCIM